VYGNGNISLNILKNNQITFGGKHVNTNEIILKMSKNTWCIIYYTITVDILLSLVNKVYESYNFTIILI